jgi:hypothetical protein
VAIRSVNQRLVYPDYGEQESGFPDSTNTGHLAAGYTSLTPSAGISTSSNGQVITGLNISGPLYVNHNNVTVTGCDIHAGPIDWVVIIDGDNATFTDCTIRGNGGTTATAPDTSPVQMYGNGWTLRRCNIYNTSGDGIRYADSSGGLLVDSYVHGWVQDPTNEPHADGVVCAEGQVGALTIDHSTIIMWCPDHMTDTVSMAGGLGDPVHDILVQNCLLAGGGHIAHGGGDGVCTNVKWLGNTIDMNAGTWDGESYGATVYGLMNRPPPWGTSGNVWSGNVTLDGTPISAP